MDTTAIDAYAIGSVRIARRVLRTVITEAALRTPGVTGLAQLATLSPTLGKPIPWRGIGLATHENSVTIDLYLIVAPEYNLAQVGIHAQETVSVAVETMLGMRVLAVNIYVQDVA